MGTSDNVKCNKSILGFGLGRARSTPTFSSAHCTRSTCRTAQRSPHRVFGACSCSILGGTLKETPGSTTVVLPIAVLERAAEYPRGSLCVLAGFTRAFGNTRGKAPLGTQEVR